MQDDDRRRITLRRRALWKGALGWLVVALAVRALSAVWVTHPGYMDAYYYFHLASNLAVGRGLVEDVIWNYLTPPVSVPRPGGAYWPPGTAVLAALPALAASWLGLPLIWGWRLAQAMPVIASSLVVAGAYAMSRRLVPDGAAARRAHTVTALTLLSGVYFPYWVTTDTFTPFALLGGGALWLSAEAAVMASDARWRWHVAGAGLMAGLAQGVRPDAGLLLVAPLIAAGVRSEGASAAGIGRRARWVAILAAGFAIGAAPWLARNWVTWGSLTPPGGSAALWLREYDDLFAFLEQPGAARWLDAGPGAALEARLHALAGNLGVLGQPLLYYLTVPAAVGLWRMRHRPALWPVAGYLVLLYTVMSLVFPFQGVRGGFFHSLAAVLPWLLLWAVSGVEALVGAAARRRRWHEAEAQRAFVGALVAFGALSSLYFLGHLTARWDARLAAYRAVGAWLDVHAPGGARVLVADPPGFWYATGRAAAVLPSDGLDALLAAAGQFGADYVAVEPAAPRYLAALRQGETAPAELARVATVGEIQLYRIWHDALLATRRSLLCLGRERQASEKPSPWPCASRGSSE